MSKPKNVMPDPVWLSPDEVVVRDKKKSSNRGKLTLIVIASGIVAGILGAAVGSLMLFFTSWLVLSLLWGGLATD